MTEKEKLLRIRSAELKELIWLAISAVDESEALVVMDALACVMWQVSSIAMRDDQPVLAARSLPKADV